MTRLSLRALATRILPATRVARLFASADAHAVAHAQVAAIHDTMDALGVPRQRQEDVFTLTARVDLFVNRLSERLSTQVENNMIYFTVCRDVVVLLEGSPNSSQFRVRQSIEKLKAVTTPSTSSLTPERTSALILPS
jgi:hypothetical protein